VAVLGERNQIIHTLNEEKERSNKHLWMQKMEEKLKAFAEVDRSSYPEDLITYFDELEKVDPSIRLTSNIVKEEKKTKDRHSKIKKKDEPSKSDKLETNKSILVDIQKTPSQEIEKRQLEQMEDISNSLKYTEKPNELNPRR